MYSCADIDFNSAVSLMYSLALLSIPNTSFLPTVWAILSSFLISLKLTNPVLFSPMTLTNI